jgi:murein DD-endopeptidase MepM/ murein hydrolase activator NlpD
MRISVVIAAVAAITALVFVWPSARGAAGGPVDGRGYLSVPVDDTYITSPYGMRMHPLLHVEMLHDGIDLHAPCGTPVYAAAAGRVTSEGHAGNYGDQLKIDHGTVRGRHLATSYNHLQGFAVGTGARVDRGQLIGYAGDTGRVTACHLHFMVYVNGEAVDPTSWL